MHYHIGRMALYFSTITQHGYIEKREAITDYIKRLVRYIRSDIWRWFIIERYLMRIISHKYNKKKE